MAPDRMEILQTLLLRMQHYNLKYVLKPIMRSSPDGLKMMDTCSICFASGPAGEDIKHNEECAYQELLHDLEQFIF